MSDDKSTRPAIKFINFADGDCLNAILLGRAEALSAVGKEAEIGFVNIARSARELGVTLESAARWGLDPDRIAVLRRWGVAEMDEMDPDTGEIRSPRRPAPPATDLGPKGGPDFLDVKEPLSVYVASSWRNHVAPLIVEKLKEEGFRVYDFREPAPGVSGFSWAHVDPTPQPWDRDRTVAALYHPRAREGFRLDLEALSMCDVCVLVLPAGRSASWEIGWAAAKGKDTFVFMNEPQPPELMFSGSIFVESFAELLEGLKKIRRHRIQLDAPLVAG